MGIAREKARAINKATLDMLALYHAGRAKLDIPAIIERGLEEYADEKLEEAAAVLRVLSEHGQGWDGWKSVDALASAVLALKSTALKECGQHEFAAIESERGDIICTHCGARWARMMRS